MTSVSKKMLNILKITLAYQVLTNMSYRYLIFQTLSSMGQNCSKGGASPSKAMVSSNH